MTSVVVVVEVGSRALAVSEECLSLCMPGMASLILSPTDLEWSEVSVMREAWS